MKLTPHDFSNTVTAVVIILMFALAAMSLLWPKKKKPTAVHYQKPATMWTGETPATAYARIIKYIATAKVPRDLDKVFQMNQDFYCEFTGRIPEREVKEYMHSIIEIKKDTRLDMIAEMMSIKKNSKISTV